MENLSFCTVHLLCGNVLDDKERVSGTDCVITGITSSVGPRPQTYFRDGNLWHLALSNGDTTHSGPRGSTLLRLYIYPEITSTTLLNERIIGAFVISCDLWRSDEWYMSSALNSRRDCSRDICNCNVVDRLVWSA